MGEYTQHGYGADDRREEWWNQPLFGNVSRIKALEAAYWAFAVAALVSLAVRAYLG